MSAETTADSTSVAKAHVPFDAFSCEIMQVVDREKHTCSSEEERQKRNVTEHARPRHAH